MRACIARQVRPQADEFSSRSQRVVAALGQIAARSALTSLDESEQATTETSGSGKFILGQFGLLAMLAEFHPEEFMCPLGRFFIT
ncbi:hypothetical protein Sme01_64840 [Sphaerisporangium melleum]|uniref:Uncharacterized protein n=1 Tax=Sphaerisporangium melleum TaxID=321316 RepID=A0A917RE65_9ACTN|nr:hypothetical protein GCM10007964_52470 [Sphaerisporangium melleum]GII74008.1 hypothetical protein Sme01_64840 [Sphaerisporangium melleum]